VTTPARHLGLAVTALAASFLGLAGCSSSNASSVPIQSNYLACAAVDAEFAFLLRGETVPQSIAKKVVSEGKVAADPSLQADAEAIDNDVTANRVRGVESNLADMGRRCDAMGVGPAKYVKLEPPPTTSTTQG